MQIVDLKSRLGERLVQEILSLAVGSPTPEKMSGVIAGYQSPTSFFLGFEEGREVVGVIGGSYPDSVGSAVIQHIAVRPDRQRSGVGRAMIDELIFDLSVSEMVAETDKEAVAFYQGVGFELVSLGEMYPGTERFRCRFRKHDD